MSQIQNFQLAFFELQCQKFPFFQVFPRDQRMPKKEVAARGLCAFSQLLPEFFVRRDSRALPITQSCGSRGVVQISAFCKRQPRKRRSQQCPGTK